MKRIMMLVLLAMLVFGCAQSPAPQGNVVQTPTASAGGDVKEFRIVARRFEFTPNTITVNKGDKVKLTLYNEDGTHGIAIREFGISLKPGPGQEASAEFTADQAGQFTFFCNVFCGEGHKSMKGTLIVNG